MFREDHQPVYFVVGQVAEDTLVYGGGLDEVQFGNDVPHPFLPLIPVSYTHLDVYKRQA